MITVKERASLLPVDSLIGFCKSADALIGCNEDGLERWINGLLQYTERAEKAMNALMEDV